MLLEIEIFVKFLIFLRIIVLFVLGIKEEILLKIEYLISLFWFLNVKRKLNIVFLRIFLIYVYVFYKVRLWCIDIFYILKIYM